MIFLDNNKMPKIKHIEFTITRSAWDCGQGHRHQTEWLAYQCAIKFERRKDKPDRINEHDRLVRNFKIAELILKGTNFKKVAKLHGVSGTTARNVTQKICRLSNIEHYGMRDNMYSPHVSVGKLKQNAEYWLKKINNMKKMEDIKC